MKRLALGSAVLALAAAAAAVIWFAYFRLDAAVAAAIEREGSAVTGTEVRVSGVDLDLRAARGTIRGLAVANPAGFSREPAFSLDEISLRIDPGSLRGAPIVVEEVRVARPRVLFELDSEGHSNLEALRRHARKSARARAEGERTAAPGAEGETRIVVRELSLEEGALRVATPGAEPRELRLRGIELRDLGREHGATPDELGRAVAEALVARTLRSVAASEAKRALEELGGRLGATLGELLEQGIEGPPGDAASRLEQPPE